MKHTYLIIVTLLVLNSRMEMTESVQHILDESFYYNTICTESFRPDDTGVSTIQDTMFPIYNQSTQDNNITIGPPDCPSQFDVKLINNDSVIISWTPGDNGGLTQTFVFYAHAKTRLDRTLVAAVVDDNNESMVYIVRNLEMNTLFVFSIQVQNNLSTTVCPDLEVSLSVSGNYNTGRAEADTNLLYYIIPPCLVVLIVIVSVVAVRKGCRAYGRKRQYKARSNLNIASLHVPLEENGYLLVLGASVGLPHIEHTYSNVQPVVGSDGEHESVGNIRVDNMRNREHALEGSNSENPYNVIQETDETMDKEGCYEKTNPSTRQEIDQTRSLGNLSGPPRLYDLTNVYDRLEANSYIDYFDVYSVPDCVHNKEHAPIL